jgi:cystathionine beta-synthase
MKSFESVLDMIGNTPLVKLNNLDTGKCELYAKIEYFNPGGSIKDRIALSMIKNAENRGLLKKGDTIIEATAGNTGLGLALIAIQKGYKLVVVMPDKMSKEKIKSLEDLGAQVITTRSDVMKGDPEYYQDKAKKLSEEKNYYYINQFCNPANVDAHYKTTAPEIWEQMGHKVDAVVCGVGSGGAITGIGRFLKEKNPKIQVILADPAGSILADYVNKGEIGKAGSWYIEGIGEDFIPEICEITLVDKAFTISDKESFLTARELQAKEGLSTGSSSGTLLAAALKYCKEQTSSKRVVTLFSDSGANYKSKMYNDEWMKEKGFL